MEAPDAGCLTFASGPQEIVGIAEATGEHLLDCSLEVGWAGIVHGH
jgi:hypothetical protein